MNKIPLVKFTLESENNNVLPFLDVLVKHRNSIFVMELYCKRAHLGGCINKSSNYSNYSNCVKCRIIKTLQGMATFICSNEFCLKKKIKKIVENISKNGYSKQCIYNVLSRKVKSKDDANLEVQGSLVIPHIKDIPEKN